MRTDRIESAIRNAIALWWPQSYGRYTPFAHVVVPASRNRRYDPYLRGRAIDQYSVNAVSSLFRNHSATSSAWKGRSPRILLHRRRKSFQATTLRGFEEENRKGKGCDIGYALAANSCEGALSVDACTVTALDAITAFAVPNPNYSSQISRFFQVRMPVELPLRANHSAYFGLAKFYFSQPFQPSTRVTLNACFRAVNAAFQCNRLAAMGQKPETQPIETLPVNEQKTKFFPFFHRSIHRCLPA